MDISIQETTDCLTVSFSNKGSPIPEPALSHIFDKFYQADTSHSTQGNGLGLSIAKKVMELLGGSLTVSSSDTGTVFAAVLPKGGLP